MMQMNCRNVKPQYSANVAGASSSNIGKFRVPCRKGLLSSFACNVYACGNVRQGYDATSTR